LTLPIRAALPLNPSKRRSRPAQEPYGEEDSAVCAFLRFDLFDNLFRLSHGRELPAVQCPPNERGFATIRRQCSSLGNVRSPDDTSVASQKGRVLAKEFRRLRSIYGCFLGAVSRFFFRTLARRFISADRSSGVRLSQKPCDTFDMIFSRSAFLTFAHALRRAAAKNSRENILSSSAIALVIVSNRRSLRQIYLLTPVGYGCNLLLWIRNNRHQSHVSNLGHVRSYIERLAWRRPRSTRHPRLAGGTIACSASVAC